MTPSRTLFSAVTFCCAALLASQAAWVLVVEAMRPGPMIQESPAPVANFGNFAANVGLVRADAWADDATYLAAEMTRGSQSTGHPDLDAGRRALAAADTALTLGPHESRMWLLIAELSLQIEKSDEKVLGPLRMSYYTGPNEAELMPRRLMLAAHVSSLDDPELRDLAQREIRVMIKGGPASKASILDAYKAAPAATRNYMRQAVADLDSTLAAQMKAAGPSDNH